MQTSWIRGAVAFMLLGPEADAAHAPAESSMSLHSFVSRLEDERTASGDSLRSWRSGESLTKSRSNNSAGPVIGGTRTPAFVHAI